jgi:predicted DNA-binding transcriptional regulator YafY
MMQDKDIPRLSRLMAILTQLQSKRLLTATEIAKKFKISIRTVYRDIKALEQAGVPILTEEGKGYMIMEGYRLPPVMFTEREANAFVTAEKLVLLNSDSSLTQDYKEGVAKIKSVLRAHARDKADILTERVAFEQRLGISAVSHYLSSIQIALTNFSLIELEYYSPTREEVTQREIEPFALINNVGQSWYLIAFCRLRKDFRLFRFDRIRKITIKDEKFTPHSITLSEYLTQYQNNSDHL